MIKLIPILFFLILTIVAVISISFFLVFIAPAYNKLVDVFGEWLHK